MCGGTGSWSKPYKDAGYDVRLITLPDYDVTTYNPPDCVYGILAAPPCTHFSAACSRLWKEKDKDGRTIEGLKVLIACLKIIAKAKPTFWALENPVGRMKHYLGPADYSYRFTDFGCPCRKQALLWGNFNHPRKEKHYYKEIYKLSEINYRLPELKNIEGVTVTDHDKRAAIRSITPARFAKAFFEANR